MMGFQNNFLSLSSFTWRCFLSTDLADEIQLLRQRVGEAKKNIFFLGNPVDKNCTTVTMALLVRTTTRV